MWLALILGMIPGIVRGIEKVVGDSASGSTKAQMAHDALQSVYESAAPVLTGSNAVYGQAAAEVAQLAIDQTVSLAKKQGVYQTWTAAANVAQQDEGVAASVVDLVKTVQASTQTQNEIQKVQAIQQPDVNQTTQATQSGLAAGNGQVGQIVQAN